MDAAVGNCEHDDTVVCLWRIPTHIAESAILSQETQMVLLCMPRDCGVVGAAQAYIARVDCHMTMADEQW